MRTINKLSCEIWIICILALTGCGNITSESKVEEKSLNIPQNVKDKESIICQEEQEESAVQGGMLINTNGVVDEEYPDSGIVLQDSFIIQGNQCCFKVLEEEDESEYQYLLEIDDGSGAKYELKSIISADEFVEENRVDRVQFEDVNFDGDSDVLIWIGATGSKGDLRYDCFLKKDADYLYCEGFSDIFNPYVDKEAQVISSTVIDVDSYYCIKYSICEEHVELIETDEYVLNPETDEYVLNK